MLLKSLPEDLPSWLGVVEPSVLLLSLSDLGGLLHNLPIKFAVLLCCCQYWEVQKRYHVATYVAAGPGAVALGCFYVGGGQERQLLGLSEWEENFLHGTSWITDYF